MKYIVQQKVEMMQQIQIEADDVEQLKDYLEDCELEWETIEGSYVSYEPEIYSLVNPSEEDSGTDISELINSKD